MFAPVCVCVSFFSANNVSNIHISEMLFSRRRRTCMQASRQAGNHFDLEPAVVILLVAICRTDSVANLIPETHQNR